MLALTMLLGLSVSAVSAAPLYTGGEIQPPPAPYCPEGGLLWQQTIDFENLIDPDGLGIPTASEVRFLNNPASPNHVTSYVLPISLPAAFDDAVYVGISEAVAWDGYLARAYSDPSEQQNEQFKVVFLLGGVVQWATGFTPDLADNQISAAWRGELGSALLPNGADTIMLVHWPAENPDTNPNSVVPSSLCIKYKPPKQPGTGTPGYWMNHPDAWPVDEIEIGGKLYSKDLAIAHMKAPVKGNKLLTMFPALVAAKLNVAIGNNASCIAGTIEDADDWMGMYGGHGEKVKANSAAWKDGEPLYIMLDKYNNGYLCAPSRDALE
jgi:hypothetical protein